MHPSLTLYHFVSFFRYSFFYLIFYFIEIYEGPHRSVSNPQFSTTLSMLATWLPWLPIDSFHLLEAGIVDTIGSFSLTKITSIFKLVLPAIIHQILHSADIFGQDIFT